MKKDYQTTTATTDVPLPNALSITLADLAGEFKEGLLALAVGTGMRVMDAIFEEAVVGLAGPKGKHDPERSAVRHGTEAGSVTLGGRRVPVRRPGVRTADGTREVAVPAYNLFPSTEVLGQMAMERMLAKLSTRRYAAGLEPVGTAVAAAARSTSRSAVSRRFVEATERALAELLGTDLAGLDLVALMINGVHFAEHCCVVAMGIGIDGTKHPLALAEGDTENASVVKDLLAGLRDRGLDTTRPILVVTSKALAAGVRAVFDHPVVHRCQLHKMSSRSCPTRSPRRWPRRCGRPTATPTPCRPRRSSRRSPGA